MDFYLILLYFIVIKLYCIFGILFKITKSLPKFDQSLNLKKAVNDKDLVGRL